MMRRRAQEVRMITMILMDSSMKPIGDGGEPSCVDFGDNL
jgi:hypothetical protein